MRTIELIEKVNKLNTPIVAELVWNKQWIAFNLPYKSPFYKIRVNGSTMVEGATDIKELSDRLIMSDLFDLLALVKEYVDTPLLLKAEPKFRLKLAKIPLLEIEKTNGLNGSNLYLMYSEKNERYSLGYLGYLMDKTIFSNEDIKNMDITGFEKEPI